MSLGRRGAWGGGKYGAHWQGMLGQNDGGGDSEPGAGGNLGREGVWGASSMRGRPLSAHPDSPITTLTLKLRHFSARREASTLYPYYFQGGAIFGNVLNLN